MGAIECGAFELSNGVTDCEVEALKKLCWRKRVPSFIQCEDEKSNKINDCALSSNVRCCTPKLIFLPIYMRQSSSRSVPKNERMPLGGSLTSILEAKTCTYATDLGIKGYAAADLAAGASKKHKKYTLVRAYAESPDRSDSFE
jgi:hypothetical protein